MEILFCDLCNESVPQSDLDQHIAFRLKGRVICSECDKAMSGVRAERSEEEQARAERRRAVELATSIPAATHAGVGWSGALDAAPPQASPGAAGGVLVGLVALVFSAAGFALLIDRSDRAAFQAENRVRALQSRLHHIMREQTTLGDRIDARLSAGEARMAAELGALSGDLRASITEVSDGLQAFELRIIGLRDDLTEFKNENSAGNLHIKERVDALTQTVQRNEAEVAVFRNTVIQIEETMRMISTQGALSATAGGAGQFTPAAERVPAWNGLLADLAHSNAGIRLDAIYSLGETRDAGVLPYVIPMLKDEDLFVRMATARTLQNLSAKSAVVALIDALEDSESAVREAAMVALRDITQRDFRFEPLAEPALRAKRIKAWRDWWSKSGEDFMRS